MPFSLWHQSDRLLQELPACVKDPSSQQQQTPQLQQQTVPHLPTVLTCCQLPSGRLRCCMLLWALPGAAEADSDAEGADANSKVLLSPSQCRMLWRHFLSETGYIVQQVRYHGLCTQCSVDAVKPVTYQVAEYATNTHCAPKTRWLSRSLCCYVH